MNRTLTVGDPTEIEEEDEEREGAPLGMSHPTTKVFEPPVTAEVDEEAGQLVVRTTTEALDLRDETEDIDVFRRTEELDVPRGSTDMDVPRGSSELDVPREPTTLDVPREPLEREVHRESPDLRRGPEYAQVLTCRECGFSAKRDERWVDHDPDEPKWVYECPACSSVHHVGPAPWTPPPIDG